MLESAVVSMLLFFVCVSVCVCSLIRFSMLSNLSLILLIDAANRSIFEVVSVFVVIVLVDPDVVVGAVSLTTEAQDLPPNDMSE